MHAGFDRNKVMGVKKRDFSPWFTTNSEYGRQVQENIQRRLIGKVSGSTHRDNECREDQENRRQDANKSRSSLSSCSSMTSSMSSLSPTMTPARSTRSPQMRLTTSEKEYLKNNSAVHLSLPPFLGQRLPPLKDPYSSLSNYTFHMKASDDSRQRSVERHYYKRRNPPSGLGKRYMLQECPRLWSNMGKLDRATTPAPVVDILKVEHDKAANTDGEATTDVKTDDKNDEKCDENR